jgi:uncharacterized membrane protein YkoI
VAQISKAEAQEKALASLGSSANPEVLEGELEVERKCLIYSFDIRVPGERGVTEIAVDAGTGSILSRTHESDRQEAAEKEHEARAPKRR